jgi:rhodanese-related sulfurtransferase
MRNYYTELHRVVTELHRVPIAFGIAICLLFFSFSITGQIPDSLKFKSISAREFHEQYLHDKNALLLDVREYADYRKSRIKYAVNIPFTKGLDITADTINKDKALFIYCYAGGRSKKAALFFYEKGFRKLYSLKGGMIGWKRDRMPVVRKKLKRPVPCALYLTTSAAAL